MTDTTIRYRPAVLALCLLALGPTSGCAHFRNAGERAAQERSGVQPAAPPPVSAPAPAPASRIAPPPPPVAPPGADNPVERAAPAAPAPMVPALSAIIAQPVTSSLGVTTAPATGAAIIIIANSPGVHCRTCGTLKISVAPSGQVLIEHGEWAGASHDWRYRRAIAHVGMARAAVFAASLSGDRPSGTQSLTDSAACPGAAIDDDGYVVEWIEAERRDMLNFKFGCPAGRHGPVAERLRHAPGLLGLHDLVWPKGSGQ